MLNEVDRDIKHHRINAPPNLLVAQILRIAPLKVLPTLDTRPSIFELRCFLSPQL